MTKFRQSEYIKNSFQNIFFFTFFENSYEKCLFVFHSNNEAKNIIVDAVVNLNSIFRFHVFFVLYDKIVSYSSAMLNAHLAAYPMRSISMIVSVSPAAVTVVYATGRVASYLKKVSISAGL